ncbi:glycosyltransferase family 4 protein [Pseudomonas sp. PDNC002]|uniref:glycosyltransferase family 4 protein n=1 Tax=Pseudomonas sp. PDNC002 TaxID=2811422 RepID=UPI001963BE7B|nr:glycosyltransferase family 1 protein [Pseudomonas sp. PDNC002]QRY80148.1 glycosyltransferase family 4 protein [Pseudomonas sp. PDNC002]
MRIGLGTSVWAKGAKAGHLDGIGVYTQALWRSLHQRSQAAQADFSVTPFAFGRELPVLECGIPQPVSGHFSAYALRAALLGPSRSVSAKVRSQVDLFHATDHHIPQLKGVPVVANVMDLIPMLHPEWASPNLRQAKNWLFGRTVRSADHIITISEYSKRDLINHLGIAADDISVTPLGVDPIYFERIGEEHRLEALAKCGVARGFFLCIGTLQPRKNLMRVLLAHQSLPADVRREHPLIVVGRNGWGADDLLPALRALEARGEGRWLDYLPQADVLALLQSATAVVFPSLYEGFGLPVVEAFAARCPVITSNSTSLPEVAGDAALLVDPLDEAAIAQAMTATIADPVAAQQRVDRGYLRARDYSWGACCEKTLAVYRQVIAQNA